MGMSIGGINGYNVYQTQPMNMALSNQAPVSDVYNKHKAVGDISTVAPVVYPNAQEVKVGEVASTDGKDEALKVAQQEVDRIARSAKTIIEAQNRRINRLINRNLWNRIFNNWMM